MPAGMQLGITSEDIQQQTALNREAFSLPSPQPYGPAGFLTPAGAAVWPQGRPAQGTKKQKKKKPSTKLPSFCQNYPELPQGQTNTKSKKMGAGENAQPAWQAKNSNCIFQELSALEHFTEMEGFNSPLEKHRNLDTYLVLHSAWEFTTELLNQFSLYTSAKQGLISKASEETELHCLFTYNWQQSQHEENHISLLKCDNM